MKKLLLTIVLLTALGMSKTYSQALVQTYVDRCTGQVFVFTVPANGQTVVAFYNKSRVFTAQEFTNGTLQAWLEQTYLWWSALSPCSTTTTGATATQQTTQQTTQQAAAAAANASQSVSTNVTTNAPPTTASTPPPAETSATSTPPPAETSTTNNTTTSGETTATNTDASTNTGETQSSGTGDASSSSSSEQTDSSSQGEAQSSDSTSESGSTEGESKTDETKSETSSEDSKSEEKTEEVKEESKEETKEETKEEKDETKEESDESKEEDGEEKKDEEESESDKDEEDKEEDSKEESDDEGEEEGDKKKKKRRNLSPPIISANLLSQQGPDGTYSYATNFGVSRSSMLGTETYGLNAMVYTNMQQFMLTANYSKVHIKTEKVSVVYHDNHEHYNVGNSVDSSHSTEKIIQTSRVNRVYSGSIGVMKMFSTYVYMMTHSMVWMGTEGAVAGVAIGTTLTSLDLNVVEGNIIYNSTVVGSSLTGFYTNSFTAGRLNIAPMVAVSNPFLSYDLSSNTPTWNKHVMVISGSSFTYALTQRFGLNVGINFIESTMKDFPTMKTFTIGGRLSF